MAQFNVKKEIKLEFNDEFEKSFDHEFNFFIRQVAILKLDNPSVIDFKQKILSRTKAIANRAFKLGLGECDPVAKDFEMPSCLNDLAE